MEIKIFSQILERGFIQELNLFLILNEPKVSESNNCWSNLHS